MWNAFCVGYLPTFQHSKTLNWRVPTQTTIHRQLHWRYQNGTNTRPPKASVLRRQITFHQHATSTCSWLYLGTAINKSHYLQPPSPTVDLMDLLLTFVWPQPTFNTTVNTSSNYMEQLWAYLFPSLRLKYSSHAKHWGAGPSNLQWNTPSLATLHRRCDHCCTRIYKIDEFHKHLNKQNNSIQFIKGLSLIHIWRCRRS